VRSRLFAGLLDGSGQPEPVHRAAGAGRRALAGDAGHFTGGAGQGLADYRRLHGVASCATAVAPAAAGLAPGGGGIAGCEPEPARL
ncbi:Nitric oxide reductase activation protein NorF, partial [Pseudomonas sp. FEN]